jgi:hypothetical protein
MNIEALNQLDVYIKLQTTAVVLDQAYLNNLVSLLQA